MPTLTATLTLSYGSTVPDGSVPCREPLTFTLAYNEVSIKTVQIAASSVDVPVLLDTVTAPKFLLVRAVVTDVTIKVSDGVVLTPTPTAVSAASGWICFANPTGQTINQFLVTTPASTTGSTVSFMAFE